VKTFPELLEKYPNAAAGLSDQMNAAYVAAETTGAGSGFIGGLKSAAGQAILPLGIAAATYFLTPEEESVEDFLKNNPTDPKRAAYDKWNALDDKQSKTATDLKLEWYGKPQYTDQQLSTLFGANPARRAEGGIMSSDAEGRALGGADEARRLANLEYQAEGGVPGGSGLTEMAPAEAAAAAATAGGPAIAGAIRAALSAGASLPAIAARLGVSVTDVLQMAGIGGGIAAAENLPPEMGPSMVRRGVTAAAEYFNGADAPPPQIADNYAGGGNIVGPGTGTSDSIPARLSDGEFVMTSRAVRNAGNGDRNLGAARMYDMMNRFERGVA
tara:strand:- start:387 stop:1370 length:984 start_codon:yes stop_codon:yes gene_type:complete